VRRYKSERNLSLGTELSRVQLATGNWELAAKLEDAIPDLMSITRASLIEIRKSDDAAQTIEINIYEVSPQ